MRTPKVKNSGETKKKSSNDIPAEHKTLSDNYPTWKGDAIKKIDAYTLDQICADIADALPLADIAKRIGVNRGSLLTYIQKDPVRLARVSTIRAWTAKLWDERAEQVISDAVDSFALNKARELAHHYRWRAAKIAPADYGDRVTQEHTGSVSLVATLSSLPEVTPPVLGTCERVDDGKMVALSTTCEDDMAGSSREYDDAVRAKMREMGANMRFAPPEPFGPDNSLLSVPLEQRVKMPVNKAVNTKSANKEANVNKAKDVNKSDVNKAEDVNNDADRKAYMREYMKKKRAESK